MRRVPFATTKKGQEIAILHLLNVPLVKKQSDLTPLQEVFLMKALPIASKTLSGNQQGLNVQKNDNDLKNLVKERRQK